MWDSEMRVKQSRRNNSGDEQTYTHSRTQRTHSSPLALPPFHFHVWMFESTPLGAKTPLYDQQVSKITPPSEQNRERAQKGINTAVQGQTLNLFTHIKITHTVLYNTNTAVWVNSGFADRTPASHTDRALSKNEFAQTEINVFTPNHSITGTLGQEGQSHLFCYVHANLPLLKWPPYVAFYVCKRAGVCIRFLK